MSILEELYYGNINPHTSNINNDDFEKLIQLMFESEDALIKQLTDEQKILLKKIRNCDSEISDITQREIFIQGFKLGAKLMLEVIQ